MLRDLHQLLIRIPLKFEELFISQLEIRAARPAALRTEGSMGALIFLHCVRGCREENLSNQPEWSPLNGVVYLCDYRLVPQPLIFTPCRRTWFFSSFRSCTAPLGQMRLNSLRRFTSFTYWFFSLKRLCEVAPALYNFFLFSADESECLCTKDLFF